MIELVGVSKRYLSGGQAGEGWAVRPTDLRVPAREFLVLLGESGSGKSTLLKMVNRLVEPTAGGVKLEGVDLRTLDPVTVRRGMGYVIQDVGLFPHLSVAENVGVVPRLLGWPAAEIAQRVDELLALVGLAPGEYATRFPAQLSGGQRQRVGVARALAARPRVLLMDEPFGAVDPINRAALQRALRSLHDTLGLTTVMVTHDLAEALTLADRIGVVRDGAILQLATPGELLRAPADAYVASLVELASTQAQFVTRAREEASSGG